MAECYTDYYKDKSKILTMLEYGEPKEREIALGSLVIHFGKDKSNFDLVWNLFLSDEHWEVRKYALNTACHFATSKKLWEITEYILQHPDKKQGWEKESGYERIVLQEIHSRYKIKIKKEE